MTNNENVEKLFDNLIEHMEDYGDGDVVNFIEKEIKPVALDFAENNDCETSSNGIMYLKNTEETTWFQIVCKEWYENGKYKLDEINQTDYKNTKEYEKALKIKEEKDKIYKLFSKELIIEKTVINNLKEQNKLKIAIPTPLYLGNLRNTYFLTSLLMLCEKNNIKIEDNRIRDEIFKSGLLPEIDSSVFDNRIAREFEKESFNPVELFILEKASRGEKRQIEYLLENYSKMIVTLNEFNKKAFTYTENVKNTVSNQKYFEQIDIIIDTLRNDRLFNLVTENNIKFESLFYNEIIPKLLSSSNSFEHTIRMSSKYINYDVNNQQSGHTLLFNQSSSDKTNFQGEQ